MSVADVLGFLGSRRVIWIDDYFNEAPERLRDLLIENVDVTRANCSPEIVGILGTEGEPDEGVREELAQYLIDQEPEQRQAIKAVFFEALRTAGRAGKELSKATVDSVCGMLAVEPDDRWPFDRAFAELPGICEGGDAEISYVVDLNDALGDLTAGVDILISLANANSRGTAFILTHEKDIEEEAQLEAQIRARLRADVPTLDVPVCVIAKERLSEAHAGENIEEALKAAIKKAGLRRSVHEVLWQARGRLKDAFEDAANALLEVAPEQLEDHVVERAFREGSSELHVVERALTAHLSRTIREMFGTDAVVRDGATRMRKLRQIKLKPTYAKPDERLADFRKAEVWESPTLINTALAPLACGDVFEFDPREFPERTKLKRFLLLGQPCDIALRPSDRRQQDTGVFVFLDDLTEKRKNLLKSAGPGPIRRNPKTPLLPFILDGTQYACDFRTATLARLSILDLATFRTDGRVAVEAGHTPNGELLPGQARVYADRTAACDRLFPNPAQPVPARGGAPVVQNDPGSLLTFANGDSFKQIYRPTLIMASPAAANGSVPALPTRVTWKLRRCGRIRMPYASALLDDYMSVMSRQAFDLDYMTGGADDAPMESVLHAGLGI